MRYLLLFTLIYCTYVTAETVTPMTIGWVETVRILPEEFDLQAKIDTGADNSSLGIIKIIEFIRDGRKWIRFTVRNNKGQTQVFERPFERYALIKPKQTGLIKRPVVNILLCIGDRMFLTPVNLTERKKFAYQLLIGRSFLQHGFLVSSSSKLTTTPDCISIE